MNTDKKFHESMLSFQKEIGAIKKDSENPFFHSRYFDINSLLGAVKPILSKHGLVLMQPLSNVNGKLAINTIITNGVDKIDSVAVLPDVLDPQKAGSMISYFRRYALQSLLALEAEDDDANLVSKPVAGKGLLGAKQVIKSAEATKGIESDLPF